MTTTTHNINLLDCYCNAVVYGDKTCEVRYNDRDYQKGDLIQFTPVWSNPKDHLGEPCQHSISDKIYMITHVTNYPDGLKEGYVVLSIKDVTKDVYDSCTVK